MARISKPRDIATEVARKIFTKLGIRKGESLEEWARRTGKTVGSIYNNELARVMKKAYEEAIREVGHETGQILKFTPMDQKLVSAMIESPDYASVFDDYSDFAVDRIGQVAFKATQEQMSYPEIQQEIQEAIGAVHSRGITIARMEMHHVYTSAKATQYKKVDPEGKNLYEWFGPHTATTTDICTEIRKRTRGGVPWDELLNILREVATGPLMMKGFGYDDSRPYTPHFNCRHKMRMVNVG